MDFHEWMTKTLEREGEWFDSQLLIAKQELSDAFIEMHRPLLNDSFNRRNA